MIRIDREQLAWSAGLMDGEGNLRGVRIYKSKYVPNRGSIRPVLSIAQSDMQVLKRFQKAVFGLGKIYGPYKYKTQSKPYWLFTVNSFEGVQAAFAALWEFLSPIKREQGKKVFQEIQAYRQLPPLKTGPRVKGVS